MAIFSQWLYVYISGGPVTLGFLPKEQTNKSELLSLTVENNNSALSVAVASIIWNIFKILLCL